MPKVERFKDVNCAIVLPRFSGLQLVHLYNTCGVYHSLPIMYVMMYRSINVQWGEACLAILCSSPVESVPETVICFAWGCSM